MLEVQQRTTSSSSSNSFSSVSGTTSASRKTSSVLSNSSSTAVAPQHPHPQQVIDQATPIHTTPTPSHFVLSQGTHPMTSNSVNSSNRASYSPAVMNENHTRHTNVNITAITSSNNSKASGLPLPVPSLNTTTISRSNNTNTNTTKTNNGSSAAAAAAAAAASSGSLPPPTRETVLQRLSEALLRRSLAKIDLSQKGLSPQDARLVKMALLQNRQLRVLKLGYNQLGDDGMKLLVTGIAQHTQLQSLDLGFNHIGDEGCQALAQALDTTRPQIIIMSQSQMQSMQEEEEEEDTQSQPHIMQQIQEDTQQQQPIQQQQQQQQCYASHSVSQLQTLYLAGNCIGQDGAMAIADVIRRGGCNTLQRLYLTGNKLGPEGVKAITEAILEEATIHRPEHAASMAIHHSSTTTNSSHGHGMQELFLGGTGLGPTGCQAVARLLASPDCRLKVISLPNCDIGDDEITRQDYGLAACIKSNRDHLPLTSLQLSFNRITHKGLEALMNALWGSKTLKELRLDNNEIGDRGAQQLAAILPYLKTLETLDVGFNNINNKAQGMKILMKAVAEAHHLITLSISGNPMQDVTSAKAVAYALAYNLSLQSLLLVHCHLTTEGQRHIAAGAVSNSRTSLRELSGFPIGPIIVTLGFPDALEHWTNEQVLNFVRLMWKKNKSDSGSKSDDEEKGLDPLSFLPSSEDKSSPSNNNNNNNNRPGPLEATIVVEVARKAFASLVANGVDIFSRQPGHPNASSAPAVVAPRDAIMLESVDGDSIVESMGEVAVSSSPPSSGIDMYNNSTPQGGGGDVATPMSSSKKDQARSFVAPPQERTASKPNQLPDPSRKKRIVEWLCSNIKHLNKLAQMPFDSGELLKLHQHYFTPVVNESGGTGGFNGHTISYSDNSSRQASSVPNVSRGSSNVHYLEESSAMSLASSNTMQSSDVNMVPVSDPVFPGLQHQQQKQQHRSYQAQQQQQQNGGVASSLPMLKRKVSYRFLGDATMQSQHLQQASGFGMASISQQKNIWGGGFSGNSFAAAATNLGSVSKMIEEGPTGHSLPPKNKRARRNRTRISFVPRIKAKLDSYLDVCHEKALITMRQLYYVEQAILSGRVNPIDSNCPRTHLSGALASDAETIVVDMI